MPNIASILKEEIARVARREVRHDTAALKKASAAHRSEIAALKRRTQELERQLRRATKGMAAAGPVSAPASDGDGEGETAGGRFSAKSLASQRRRLGLSAAECGMLVGSSGQSIYNWEDGKARPRAKHLPAIFALRKLGRKQAAAQLASLKQ